MEKIKQTSLTQEQAEWLATKLQIGIDYMLFGTQHIFFLDEEQWSTWIPLLPRLGEPASPAPIGANMSTDESKSEPEVRSERDPPRRERTPDESARDFGSELRLIELLESAIHSMHDVERFWNSLSLATEDEVDGHLAREWLVRGWGIPPGLGPRMKDITRDLIELQFELCSVARYES